MKIYIDEQELTTIGEPTCTLDFSAEIVRSLDAAREAKQMLLTAELAPASQGLFGGEGYLHAAERFNRDYHSGRITYEANTIFEGDVTLRSVERVGLKRIYTFAISRVGVEWVESAADTILSDTQLEYEIAMRQADFKAAWEDELPVQFFPVHRDDYSTTISSDSLDSVLRIRSVDDYHPFINAAALLHNFVEVEGYTIESDFVDSELFKSLYLSGSYVSQNNDVVKEAMDFYVKKQTDEEAEADYWGRVSISPYIAYSSLDSLVDIDSITSDAECYTRGNCFTYEDGAVRFTPTTAVSVGFEFRFLYTSDYWIESRERLKGFDTFFLGESPVVQIDLINHFDDQRSEPLEPLFEYMLIVFDHTEGSSYRLVAYLDDDSAPTTLASWSGRSCSVTTPSFSNATSVTLQILDGSTYIDYTEDWALYQGYIEERGEVEIDATIRSTASTVSPTSPYCFDNLYIEGAEEGATLKLKAGTSISPYFTAYPGYGSMVEFEDIAQHESSQLTVVESLQHLFNLGFYSDPISRKVYIEPMEQLYGRDGVIWDWSDRVDTSASIVYEDIAQQVATTRRWGYQSGDGVTNRTNGYSYTAGENYPEAPEKEPTQRDEDALSTEYGSWSKSIDNYATKSTSQTLLNALFSPTQNDLDGLPIVGDRDDAETAGSLEFTPRIVRFVSMQEVDDETIPLVTFHDASLEGNVTLCFEDRDGLVGLNEYYREQIDREESGQYVTLSLKVAPHQIAQLLTPTQGAPSVLSLFRVVIDGESAVCRIESIEEYSLESGVARCKLLIIK